MRAQVHARGKGRECGRAGEGKGACACACGGREGSARDTIKRKRTLARPHVARFMPDLDNSGKWGK